MKIFKDRESAGKLLAAYLKWDWGNLGDKGIVLGIPRGGVVVAAEIAKDLKLPLDIIVTRKIGAPFQKELALGAVDADGEVVWGVGPASPKTASRGGEFREIVEEELKELKRRETLYRQGKKPLNVENKIVILVDDGIATGATTLVAVNFLKRHQAKKVILAVPVASKESVERVRREIGDMGEVVVLETPEYFEAVGQFYENFLPVSDEEVIQLLS